MRIEGDLAPLERDLVKAELETAAASKRMQSNVDQTKSSWRSMAGEVDKFWVGVRSGSQDADRSTTSFMSSFRTKWRAGISDVKQGWGDFTREFNSFHSKAATDVDKVTQRLRLQVAEVKNLEEHYKRVMQTADRMAQAQASAALREARRLEQQLALSSIGGGAGGVSRGAGGGGGGVFGGAMSNLFSLPGLVAAGSPLIMGGVGGLSALLGSAGAATVGAGALGTAGLGGFLGGLIPILATVKPQLAEVKKVTQALKKYDQAVRTYGKGSVGAATALKQLQAAQAGAGPEATKLAKTWEDLGETWRKQSQTVLPSLVKVLDPISKSLKNLMPTIADAAKIALGGLGTALKPLEKFIDSDKFKGLIKDMAESFAKLSAPGIKVIINLMTAFMEVAKATTPFLVDMVKNWVTMTGHWAKSASDGEHMHKVIYDLVQQFRSWMGLFGALGRVAITFFGTGAKQGQDWVNQMTGGLDRLNAKMKSVTGQKDLHNFFTNAIELTKTFFSTFKPFAQVWGHIAMALMPAINAAMQGLLPIVRGIADFITTLTDKLPGLLKIVPLLTVGGAVLVGWKALGSAIDSAAAGLLRYIGFQKAAQEVSGVPAGQMSLPVGGGATSRLGRLGQIARGVLPVAGTLVGGSLAIAGISSHNAPMTIGGGALTGAGIGTMIEPGIGTAIGAGIGLLAGAVTSILNPGPTAAQKFTSKETKTGSGFLSGMDISGFNRELQKVQDMPKTFGAALGVAGRGGRSFFSQISTGASEAAQALIKLKGKFEDAVGANTVRLMGGFSKQVNQSIVGPFVTASQQVGSVVTTMHETLGTVLDQISHDVGLKTKPGLKQAQEAWSAYTFQVETAIGQGRVSVQKGTQAMAAELSALRKHPRLLGAAFDAMSTSIRDAMGSGKVSVADGTKQIIKLLDQTLKNMGVDVGTRRQNEHLVASANAILNNSTTNTLLGAGGSSNSALPGGIDYSSSGSSVIGSFTPVGATGLRVPGAVGPDSVGVYAPDGTARAVVAPGELLVANRHTESRIDKMLSFFGTSLGHEVAGESKRHDEPMMARGGRLLDRLATGGRIGFSGLEALWVKAGGPKKLAWLMAQIAEAESGGWPLRNYGDPAPGGGLRTGDGGRHKAAGLWQILGLPFQGDAYNPLVNAKMAVRKWLVQGLGAWKGDAAYEKYVPGHYATGAGQVTGGHAYTGRMQAAAQQIKAPIVKGVAGTVGKIAQQALNMEAHAANQFITRQTPSVSGVAGAGIDVKDLSPRVKRAIAWARAHGWHGSVTSGVRSLAEQTYLWNNSAALGLVRGVSVAKPGTSMHERGLAIDVTDVAAFKRAMATAPANARLYWRGPADPVHFSTTGHAKGGRIPAFSKGGGLGAISVYRPHKKHRPKRRTSLASLVASPKRRHSRMATLMRAFGIDDAEVKSLGNADNVWQRSLSDYEDQYGRITGLPSYGSSPLDKLSGPMNSVENLYSALTTVDSAWQGSDAPKFSKGDMGILSGLSSITSNPTIMNAVNFAATASGVNPGDLLAQLKEGGDVWSVEAWDRYAKLGLLENALTYTDGPMLTGNNIALLGDTFKTTGISFAKGSSVWGAASTNRLFTKNVLASERRTLQGVVKRLKQAADERKRRLKLVNDFVLAMLKRKRVIADTIKALQAEQRKKRINAATVSQRQSNARKAIESTLRASRAGLAAEQKLGPYANQDALTSWKNRVAADEQALAGLSSAGSSATEAAKLSNTLAVLGNDEGSVNKDLGIMNGNTDSLGTGGFRGKLLSAIKSINSARTGFQDRIHKIPHDIAQVTEDMTSIKSTINSWKSALTGIRQGDVPTTLFEIQDITGRPARLAAQNNSNDQQAIHDQTAANALLALANAKITKAWADAIGSPGDIGAGGTNALGAVLQGFVGSFAVGTTYVPRTGPALVHEGEAIIPKQLNPFVQMPGGGDWQTRSGAPAVPSGAMPQVVQNNYMLHPSDPAVLKRVGEAATAGMGFQGYRHASRTKLGY